MMRQLLPTGPLPLRWAAIGAAAAGLAGAVVGLILGLNVHPATAGFAIFEIAIPASIVGGLVGFATGAIAYVVGRKDTNPSTGDVRSHRSP
jgi:hypothetical protein